MKKGYIGDPWQIETSDLSRAQYAQLISENKEKYAYKSDAISIADLYQLVKEYDEDLAPPAEVSPALLNDDKTFASFDCI